VRLPIGRAVAAVSFLCLLIISVLGCDIFPTQTKDGLPADHSDKKGYAYHKAGLYIPLTNCSDCHGQTIKGGVSTTNNLATPSCYQCHTDIWGDINHTLLQTGPDGSFYHKAGLYQPAANCTECHGQDLKGGSYRSSTTQSCYKCHGPTWNWQETHTLLKTGTDPQGYHVPTGLYRPETYCARCHGANLRGGTFNGAPTKSCYQCHTTNVWNWQASHTYQLTGIDGSGYHVQSGLYQPQTNCASCHGTDLRGGTSGKSCYQCHTRAIWDWTATHTLLKTGTDPQGKHDPVGLYQPETYCSSCHGANLRGGTFNGAPTKSCYQCHTTNVWNWRSTHTLLKTGTDPQGYHVPTGINQPQTYCASCHGTDLRGGTSGISCYKCHNSAVWDWRSTHTVRKDGKYHHPDYKRNPSMCQSCHGASGKGGTARSCYGSGCHRGSWPPTDD
jgi:hypothetical protein